MTILRITRFAPIRATCADALRNLLDQTSSSDPTACYDSLIFPVSEIPIGDSWELSLTLILSLLASGDEVVAFEVIEESAAPDGKRSTVMPRHWLVSPRHEFLSPPERIDGRHGETINRIANILDGTHVGRFKRRATPTVFGRDERLVRRQPDCSWIICDLDGNNLQTVPAAA